MPERICLKCLTQIPAGHHYGLHGDCFKAWFKVDELYEFTGLERKSADSKQPPQQGQTQDRSYNSSFFHGQFRKYSAELAAASYIFKMREDKAPELPEVEFVCNQIAGSLGLPVAEHYFIEFMEDRVFVTKNFIKKTGSTADLSHIYKFIEAGEEYSCDALIRIISQHTKRPYDIEVFVNATLFDSIIGNHDRHGRNLGLVVTPSKTTLSPIYDNTSYLGLEKGNMLKADFNPSGKVATKETLRPSIKDYVIEFKRLNQQEVVEAFYSKIKLAKINSLIDASFCTQLMKAALKKIIEKRYLEFQNELGKKA